MCSFSGNIFGIPDASAISAAKKEREMRRKKGLSDASDYIPLSEDTDVMYLYLGWANLILRLTIPQNSGIPKS